MTESLYATHSHVAVGVTYHALQSAAWAHLNSLGHAIFHHVLHNVAPAHWRGELLEQVGLDFLRIGVRLTR